MFDVRIFTISKTRLMAQFHPKFTYPKRIQKATFQLKKSKTFNLREGMRRGKTESKWDVVARLYRYVYATHPSPVWKLSRNWETHTLQLSTPVSYICTLINFWGGICESLPNAHTAPSCGIG
jgi:hypothetical protein